MHVLVTGMSGTGKSTVVKELRRRGYPAFDADDDGFTTPRADGRWVWRVGAIEDLLSRHGGELMFFSGCSDEQADVHFDLRVLLTAPVEVVMARLRDRTTSSFGRSGPEQELVLADIDAVQPRLRASCDLVVDTTLPLKLVVDRIINEVEASAG